MSRYHPQRAKGGKWERDVAQAVNKALEGASIDETYIAIKGIQFRGGTEAPDVAIINKYTNQVVIRIECKHEKRTNPKAALRQSIDDGKATPNAISMAVCKENRQDPIAVMRWDDMLLLIREFLGVVKHVRKPNNNPTD